MPNLIKDPYLGTIQYCEDDEFYKGQINYDNNQVVEFYLLDLDFDSQENLKKTLEYTGKIVNDIILNHRKYKLFAADKLLELHNETWNEGKAIDTQDFIRLITLDVVHIYSDDINNTANIYYNDGDLFWGHSIVIYTNSKGELKNAEIMG